MNEIKMYTMPMKLIFLIYKYLNTYNFKATFKWDLINYDSNLYSSRGPTPTHDIEELLNKFGYSLDFQHLSVTWKISPST